MIVEGRGLYMERAIITGATSIIGIALIKKLLQEGKEVCAVIRPDSARKKDVQNLRPTALIEAELDELDRLELPANSFDVLFHIGWSSDFPEPRFNLQGQLQNVVYGEKALHLAHRCGCDTFLSIGSQAECGRVEGCITPDTPSRPENAYAIAKTVAAAKLQSSCEELGIRFCWPRLLSSYGPYDRPHTLIMQCIRAALTGRTIALTPGGQIWDYVYADDVALALSCIAERGKHGKKYPIGSGHAQSLRSYIEKIAEAAGNDCILNGLGQRPYAENQVMNLLADLSETTQDTGFRCRTDFGAGIRETVEYMKGVLCRSGESYQ